MNPDVSVLIVNWNTRDLLTACLRSVESAQGPLSLEVFVVDNGSTDGSPQEVAEAFPHVTLIANERNRGYGAANNQALASARGRVILFLNSDALITEEALAGMVAYLDSEEKAGCVTPQLVHPDGTLQNTFDNVPGLASELLNKTLLRLLFPARFPSKLRLPDGPTEVEAPIGACLAVKKAVLDQVGHFDERFFFFLEETDLCLRIRQAGFLCILLPRLQGVHGQGQSKARRPTAAWIEYYRSNYAFFRKHRSPAAYLLLRAGRFLKLNANVLFTFFALLLTAGLHRRSRRKLPVYAGLLWWHLRFCPRKSGLQENL